MTLNEIALMRTVRFVASVLVLGALGAYAIVNWPTVTMTVLGFVGFSYITYLYYQVTKFQLTNEVERAERALKR
jgi:threonine/homoserine/homoserine lactone efflux protein